MDGTLERKNKLLSIGYQKVWKKVGLKSRYNVCVCVVGGYVYLCGVCMCVWYVCVVWWWGVPFQRVDPVV